GPYAKEATPALLEAARDPAPEVREWAAKALGRTSQGTAEAVRELVEALQDKQASVRAAAAGALAGSWIADNSSPTPGRRGRREGEGEGSGAGGRGKREGRGEEAEPPQAADRGKADAGLAAASLVPRLSPAAAAAARAAVPVLTEALRDPDASVRAHA